MCVYKKGLLSFLMAIIKVISGKAFLGGHEVGSKCCVSAEKILISLRSKAAENWPYLGFP